MVEIERKRICSGERVLMSDGRGRMRIIHEWYGKKTRQSSKPTLNRELIESGPEVHVRRSWTKFMALYR